VDPRKTGKDGLIYLDSERVGRTHHTPEVMKLVGSRVRHNGNRAVPSGRNRNFAGCRASSTSRRPGDLAPPVGDEQVRHDVPPATRFRVRTSVGIA
jgi:hypothetical protein